MINRLSFTTWQAFNKPFTVVILVFSFFAVPLQNKSITLMDSILLIFLCLLVGLGLQKVSAFPKNGYLALNQFVIYVALPALALFYIPKIAISYNLLYPLGVAWIGFLFAFLLLQYFSLAFCLQIQKRRKKTQTPRKICNSKFCRVSNVFRLKKQAFAKT